MASKYRGTPRGECPTIKQSDEDTVVVHAKQRRVAMATRNRRDMPNAVRNSFNRISRERKRMTYTPCAKCVIRATCAKRKTHRLHGCEYAIIATPDGPKAACAASIATARSRFKKGGVK